MKGRSWRSRGGPSSSSPRPRKTRSGAGWGIPPRAGKNGVPGVPGLMSLHFQVTQGIFMKIIEEIDRLDNSYSRSTGCRLM